MSPFQFVPFYKILLLLTLITHVFSIADVGIQKDTLLNNQDYLRKVWSYSAIIKSNLDAHGQTTNALADLARGGHDGKIVNLVKRAAEAMKQDLISKNYWPGGPTLMAALIWENEMYFASSTANSQEIFQTGEQTDLQLVARLMAVCGKNLHRIGGRCGEFNLFSLVEKHRGGKLVEEKLVLEELEGVFVTWNLNMNQVRPPCDYKGTDPERYGCHDFFKHYCTRIRVIGEDVRPDETGEDEIAFTKVPNPRSAEYACPPAGSL